MCLIALALGASPAWPLVLAGNRDEFFDRPTLPLSRWQTDEGAELISGRDLEAGGTWMGMAPSGRVAVLTNVREAPARPGGRSRGQLPLDWLRGHTTAEAFLAQLDPQAYSGFNLLIGDVHQGPWLWASNRQDDGQSLRQGWQQQVLMPGIYGLSNAFLDTPWPKTLQLRQALAQALGPTLDEAALWQALADDTPAATAQLPRTGVPLQTELQLSSAFVRFPDGRYGTRASTVLVVQRDAKGLSARMQEKTWTVGAPPQLREQFLHWPQA